MSRITPAPPPADPQHRASGARPRDGDPAAPTRPGTGRGAITEPGPRVPTPDGRSTRWADHRLARRAELVHAARRAVHRFGPDVSMDEIAATAQTSKSIVYRYFVDKTGLQVAVGAAVVAQMHAALEDAVRAADGPRDALAAMIDIYLEMAEASPNVYWFVTRPVSEDASAPLGHFLDAVAALVARPFARLLDGRPGAAWLDVWAAGAVGFVRGAGEWWLTQREAGDAPSREVLTERVTAWLWAGPVGALAEGRADTREEP